MSITVSAVKARQNLGELLNIVSIRHEDVIIERAGKKIARLTSVEPESGAINEPVSEQYVTRNEKGKGVKLDLSEFFGTWSEEEYREFNAAVECLGTIDPEMWE
jgi:prevent-host-death family protein